MIERTRQVEALLLGHAAARRVWERSAQDTEAPDKPAFRAAYARAARLLGPAATETLEAPEALRDVARPHWTLLDWTRAALLLAALERVPGREPELVLNLLERGELGEQESLLRTLALLPGAERFVEAGLLACRTNARRVFEAIARDNVYPARHFPEHGFNQMVMKAIFLAVPLARVEGLAARITPELVRMARDYASERTAAGRPVPEDIELILQHATRVGHS